MRVVTLRRQASTALIALLALAAAPAAWTATKSGKKPTEAVYRCRDANGQSYFGQSIPAECMNLDVEVLDSSGQLIRTIPGQQGREQIAAQKSAEEAAKAAAQRDRTLLATYLSVADIERLRDQRLELLDQQARVTEQYIANLRDREARLMNDVRRFRPYSESVKAPPLPDHVAEEIVNTVNGLQVYEQELAKCNADQERLRTEFAADIARFKELKGLN